MTDEHKPKVWTNHGGATVLQCVSGNPLLGVVVSPGDDGLILSLPTGEHALDGVAVRIDPEQCRILSDLADKAARS